MELTIHLLTPSALRPGKEDPATPALRVLLWDRPPGLARQYRSKRSALRAPKQEDRHWRPAEDLQPMLRRLLCKYTLELIGVKKNMRLHL